MQFKILFPTEFGPLSEKARQFALQIAHRQQSRLLIHHAWQHPESEGVKTGHPGLVRDTVFKLESMEAEILGSELGKGLKIDLHNRSGKPVEGILAIARDMQVNMIVMGTRGVIYLDENFLGTATTHIIKHASIPVLAIPETWEKDGIDKVLMGINLDEGPDPNLDFVLNFLRSLKVSPELVHISTEKEKLTSEELTLRAERISAESGFPVSVVKAPDPWTGLTGVFNDRNMDILAMISHKRPFWSDWFSSSLTRKMAKYGNIPILAFHK